MHNATFNELGLDHYYFPIEVGKDGLEAVLNGLRHMNFIGCNVTKPNKVRVMRYLDEVDDLASKIGAVNTIKIENGKMKGYNTDGEGYVASLKTLIGDVKGKTFTLLGAGGAGRAIAFTLANHGAEKIYLFDKVVECGQKVVSEVNSSISHCSDYIFMSEENLKQAIDASDVLINATGAGMMPNVDVTPIDKNLLKKGMIVSDITYNPVKTKLLLEAEEMGCISHNGIGMLIYQGAMAFEIWTGIEAPIESMTKTVMDIVTKLND
jgi:shikimate dehydrogenase